VALGGLLLADQRQQRVGALGRVEVEHQPVPVGGHRGQRELLRRTGCFRSNTRRTTRGWYWPTRTPAM
jgi:hypothetical protein